MPNTTSQDSVVVIYNALAYQMEFIKDLEGDGFASNDCIVYGADGVKVGIEVCLARSQIHPGAIRAGTD